MLGPVDWEGYGHLVDDRLEEVTSNRVWAIKEPHEKMEVLQELQTACVVRVIGQLKQRQKTSKTEWHFNHRQHYCSLLRWVRHVGPA
jgi:hypothetical protein